MPSAGFEPTIPANSRPQILALDLSATGICSNNNNNNNNNTLFVSCLLTKQPSDQLQIQQVFRVHVMKECGGSGGMGGIHS